MKKSAIMELTGKGAVMEKTKADVVLKNFWRDNERFADLFNTVLFQGKNIIHAEELQEMDTQAVFEISRDAFEKKLDAIREKYRNVDLPSETAAVIGKIVGSEELIRMSEKAEVINMCTALEELKQEGRDEGMAMGRAEGIALGRTEGIEQGKLTLIINMLNRGMEIKDIIYFAGVTEEEIEQAKKSAK